MKIGVLGSGVVAQTLAAGLAKHGHEVAVGTRNPAKLSDWQGARRDVRLQLCGYCRVRRCCRARGVSA